MIKSLSTLNHGYAEFQDEKSPGSLLHEELNGPAMWRAGKECAARLKAFSQAHPGATPLQKFAEIGACFGGAVGAFALLPADLIFGTGVTRGGGFDLVDPVALKQHLLHSFAHPTESGMAGIFLGLLVATVFIISGSLGALAGASVGLLAYVAVRHKVKSFASHMTGSSARGVDAGVLGLGSGLVMVSGLVPATMALGGMRFLTGLFKGAAVGVFGAAGALIAIGYGASRSNNAF